MASVRVRLKFEDESILSRSQRLNGLNRCWIVVEPSTLRTISDLLSYLLHTFHLSATCPHGLLLSMDGFVLPHFEFTSILKDKDLVCVKRVRSKSKLPRTITECGVKEDVMEPEIVANNDGMPNGDVSVRRQTPNSTALTRIREARSTSRKKARRKWLRAQRLNENKQKHLQQVEDLSADVAF